MVYELTEIVSLLTPQVPKGKPELSQSLERGEEEGQICKGMNKLAEKLINSNENSIQSASELEDIDTKSEYFAE